MDDARPFSASSLTSTVPAGGDGGSNSGSGLPRGDDLWLRTDRPNRLRTLRLSGEDVIVPVCECLLEVVAVIGRGHHGQQVIPDGDLHLQQPTAGLLPFFHSAPALFSSASASRTAKMPSPSAISAPDRVLPSVDRN
jgi:hypothetical protein